MKIKIVQKRKLIANSDVNILYTATIRPHEVCSPHVCGPYSICHEVNNHPVCSCQAGYIGMPPNCRAECQVSSDCPQDKACDNLKCINPCKGNTCAQNAICKVVNHNAICSCSRNFTGDPFVRCIPIESKIMDPLYIHTIANQIRFFFVNKVL